MWKSVIGYEGLYEVSDSGYVRSLDRVIGNGIKKKHSGKELSQRPNSSGYMRVVLTALDGSKKHCFVHRLVADAFCEKKSGNNVVNHIDSNPLNNRADNLEWTTYSGNLYHAIRCGRWVRTKEWQSKISESLPHKKVIATNIKTGDTITYPGINITRKDGFSPACVSNCCKGKRKTHKGYVWRYA